MNFQRLIDLFLALLVVVGIAFVWDYRPDPWLLTLDASSSEQGEQRLNAFFVNALDKPDSIARQNSSNVADLQRYYFEYPKHFDPVSVIIDLGAKPSSWNITHIGTEGIFLLFSLDFYEWERKDFAKIVTAPPLSAEVSFAEEVVVTDATIGPRIKIQLDLDQAQITTEFWVLKVLSALLFLGLVWLLRSGYIFRLLRDRDPDWQRFREDGRFIAQNKFKWIIGGICLCLAVLLLNTSPHWQYPGLHIEDSMEFSDFASGRADLLSAETYLYYRGYYVFVSEWLGALASLFPSTAQPHLYLLFGSALMFIGIIALAYSGLIKSNWLLLVTPTVLFFGAFTNQSFYITLTGTLFSSTVLLMALAIWRPPTGLAIKLIYLLIVTALAWSGPYGAHMLVFALGLLLLFGAGMRVFFFIYLIGLAVFYAASAPTGAMLNNLLDPAIYVAIFRNLTEYVLLLNLFGTVGYEIGLSILLAVAAAIYVFRHDAVFVKFSLIFLMTGLSALLAYFISFKYHQYQGVVISSHIVISQLCWLVFLMMLLDRITARLSTPVLRGAVLVVSFAALATGLWFKDQKLRTLVSLPNDPKLPIFLAAVDKAKEIDLPADRFIQLWYPTYDLFSPTFIRRGSPQADKVLSREDTPKELEAFLVDADFARELNTMLFIDTQKDVLREVSVKHEANWRAIERAPR